MTEIYQHDFSRLDWYVLRVLTFFEIVIAIRLLEAGFHSFCPFQFKYKRSRKNQIKEKVAEALYQGYVFCGFRTKFPPWDELFSRSSGHNQGVLSVLGVGGKPCVVPYSKMSTVFGESGYVAPIAMHRGSFVEIVGGLLDGHQGVVEDLEPKRVNVSFLYDGGIREISMPIETVRLVS